jgi:hypothetical protein
MRELADGGDGDAVRAFLGEFIPESTLDFQQPATSPLQS